MPLQEQQVVLRAALQSGPEARRLALAWLSTADVDSMDAGARRLMPQLYDRLRGLAIEDSLLPRLKGLKKHAWSKNQLLFRRLCDAIGLLRQAGIDAMVIKGMAMIVGYYHDFSLRPMDDADLLVPYPDARRASEVLVRHGWISQYADPADPRRGEWAFQHEHAAHMQDPLHRDLDLHWNLLEYRLGPDVDADFWSASVEATFGGQTVRILNPADQLLHVCVHATELVPIAWIPDAVIILRSTPDFDWNRLLSQARKRRLAFMVANALQLVQASFADLVPAPVVQELLGSPVSRFERFEYLQAARPPSHLLGCARRTICKFLRLSRGKSLPVKFRFLADFLCFHWKVARIWQLPAAFCGKCAARFRACALHLRQAPRQC